MIAERPITVPLTYRQFAELLMYADMGHQGECVPECPMQHLIDSLKDWLIEEHPEVFEAAIITDPSPN